MPVLQPFREETVGDVPKLRLQLNDMVREVNAMSSRLFGVTQTMAESSATSELAAIVPLEVQKTTPDSGVSSAYAKADHQHSIQTAVPVSITDSTNAEGTASTLARSNHQHAHGNRGGGSLHAVVTSSVDGFFKAADYVDFTALLRRLPVYKTQTSNNTPKNFTLDSMSFNTSQIYNLNLVARKSGATTSAFWFAIAAFGCDGSGTVTQIGATSVLASSLGAWTVTASVSGTNPVVTVTAGASDGAVDWTLVAIRGEAP